MRYMFRRLLHSPLPAIGVLLFAAILSTVLCGLELSNTAEENKYQETYRTISVEATITNLSGTKYTGMNIDAMFMTAFEEKGDLEKYVTNLQKVCMRAIDGKYSGNMLYGITSTVLSPELSPENGVTITWRDGYHENIFFTDKSLCLIPQGMIPETDEETGEKYIELYFEHWKDIGQTNEYTCRLTVAGTYAGGSGKAVYTPYSVCEQVYRELEDVLYVQAFRATLINNNELEVFREASKVWFAEPNPLGEETPWENPIYPHYPFALDINDDLLQRAAATLQSSINTNRICAVLVLCLSAAAGLLIGFLMVRSRKREIALMRTMGTCNSSIFFGFALEQMLCFGLGIAFGGACNAWEPASQLVFLAAVFFAGLTIALLIFLRNNLMTTIKEDD